MKKVKSFFGIEQKNSKISQEVIAGIVVFLAMIYILPLNSYILGESGMDAQAVFIATALASAIATLIMGLVARYPVALSAGMGLNAFFTYTVCMQLNYTWQEALTITLIAGIIFVAITLTPIRRKIIEAIPKSLKEAIIVGLGAFIAFVGLKNIGFIEGDVATLVKLGDFNNAPMLLGLLGIVLVLALMNIKGKISNFAIPIAMAITAIVGLICGALGVDNMPEFTSTSSDVGAISKTFGQAFLNFDVLSRPETYAVIFSFIFVNLFDTTATLLSVGSGAGILNSEGELIGGQKAMLADAGGAIIGAALGTSPVTSFAESNTGIEMGGRTGLSATVTGLLFAISIFAYPVFSIFTHPAVTGMALVAIGAMMFSHLKNIDWNDKIIVITTFLVVVLMIICYSISDGLGLGLIAYVIMMLASRREKEVNPILYIIAALFVVSYIINAVTFTSDTAQVLASVFTIY